MVHGRVPWMDVIKGLAHGELAVVAAHAVPLENAVALALIDLGPVCHWDDQLVVRRDLSAAKC